MAELNGEQATKFLDEALECIRNDDIDGLEQLPIGVLIAAADAQRETKRVADRIAKQEEKVFKVLELAALNAIVASGTEEAPCFQAGAIADDYKITATVTETDVPSAENWESIYQYIKENNAFELLQKRLSAKACQEAAEFDDIEGMAFYRQKKLALRRTPR